MQSAEEVANLYRAGVDAVATITGSLDDDAWASPACGAWDAADTSRHLLGVARWYHSWLDRAAAGDTDRPFPEAELDERADADVRALGSISGPDAAEQFEALALDYLDRAQAHWDLTYAYPFGVVTTGLHAGVAAVEWHIHAWDLSGVTDRRHVPAEADRLFVAAAACIAEGQGGVRGALLARFAPFAARREPWQTMLKRSGR